ncbi:hypothetical protein, partial [Burkholderia multivorans]|uniref:hypothetical protein n=1 Tax=Burkholderia multivorans TaxID=87883 RepID=UPI001C65BE63
MTTKWKMDALQRWDFIGISRPPGPSRTLTSPGHQERKRIPMSMNMHMRRRYLVGVSVVLVSENRTSAGHWDDLDLGLFNCQELTVSVEATPIVDLKVEERLPTNRERYAHRAALTYRNT